MRFVFMTLFPDMCRAVCETSIIGRAVKKGAVSVGYYDIRDYTVSRQKRVDDAPFGGGRGMLMQAQPIDDCFNAVCADLGRRPHLIFMSPRGRVFTQERAKELAKKDDVAFLCGHYEGVDQRIIDKLVDEEISVGDYVVTGGELPALTVCDAVARMCPGVLRDEEAVTLESHWDGVLEYPQYTQPAVYGGVAVPEILLSGDHAAIAKYRRREALKATLERRPDLLRTAELSFEDVQTLISLRREMQQDEPAE